MRLHFTDYPHYVPLAEYENAMSRMVEKLSVQPGVISIYQIGSISTPGISDIDMLVVFEDGIKCELNPLQDLSKSERYLFAHGLYGIFKTNFFKAQRYTFFHNYNLLWGEQLPIVQSDLSEDDIQVLKNQIALEYLIKKYISMTVELTYRIIKMRVLLLQTKAMLYDLELLKISSGRLFDLIQTIVIWRNSWFERTPTEKMLRNWIKDFYAELINFVKILLQTKKFYLPTWANFRIARNIVLVPSDQFGYTHIGITLPSMFGALGRKYFNLQHRFNKFNIMLPITSLAIPKILESRVLFSRETNKENKNFLPNFMPLTSILNI